MIHPGIVLRTLIISSAGAGLAWLLSVPVPFLTGPAIAVTLAGLSGFSAEIPDRLRDAVFVVIGLTMGQSVTPSVLKAAAAWPVTLAFMAGMLVSIILLTRGLLMRHWGMDALTAMLCSSPGHLSYVLGLTEGVKADLRTVSIVQSIRLLCLTLIVPFIVVLSGPLPTVSGVPLGNVAPLELAILIALAACAGWVLQRLRFPAAYLIGGLAVSAILHVTGSVSGAVPQLLALGAYVTMGGLIGSRFSGVSLAELKHSIGAGLAVTVLAVLIAGLFAMLVARVAGFNTLTVLIAFAPGGVETMSAMSVLLGLDPAFVAAHHVARLFMLTLIVPFFVLRRQDAPQE